MNYQDVNEQQKKGAGFNFDYGELLDELITKLPPSPLVVELGTYLGCSTVYMAEALAKHADSKFIKNDAGVAQINSPRLYTVDLFESYGNSRKFFPQTMDNFRQCGVRDQIHVLSCRTWEAAGFFEDKEVDMVWVDASHEFVGAKADLDAWWAKVKPGGILAGHDYSEKGVALAVDRFCFQASKKPTIWPPGPEGWKSWWFTM